MSTENVTVRFRTNSVFKETLENVAENLSMNMSELIREAVQVYIASRERDAHSAFMARACSKKFNFFPPEMSAKERSRRIGAITANSSLQTYERWSDRAQVDDERFEEFFKLKIEVFEAHAALAEA